MEQRLLFTCLGWPTAQADQDYYPAEISAQLVVDWKEWVHDLSEMQFTSVCPWGFLCNTFPFPLRVGSPGSDTDAPRVSPDHVSKARQIVDACHAEGIDFYYGMCVYFAHYADYLAANPAAAPSENKSIPCPLDEGDPARGIPGSIDFMKQSLDFVVQSIPGMRGVGIESFHHGRCRCERCLAKWPDTPRGTAEFHRYANMPIFKHLRERHPSLKILFCPEGPLEVIQRSENIDILEETLRAVDYFVWCGAIQAPEIMRQLKSSAPTTGFMMRQEPWQSVPPPGPRDGWFFPNLSDPFGRTVHERSKVIDWAGIAGCGLGTINPSDRVNLRYLASVQLLPEKDPVLLARHVLQDEYGPRNEAILDDLYRVWAEPEQTFRAHWPTWFLHIDFMPTQYRFTPEQTVEMINAYQVALARLRAIKPGLDHRERADLLETSMVKWITYIKDRLKREYAYEMP